MACLAFNQNISLQKLIINFHKKKTDIRYFHNIYIQIKTNNTYKKI